MLQYLEIENYALIEHLSIHFDSGFSVITGETGAGKSIIMGALALVLGDRADTKVIQQGHSKCIVEAGFDISKLALQLFFEENEIDYMTDCIVRREVMESGKSRAFINDTPVNLTLLRQFSEQLIDIHSQHESLLLGTTHFQLDVLDTVAGTTSLKEDYAIHYQRYRTLNNELKQLIEQQAQWASERDYAQFQYDQLAELNLQEEEQTLLEQELDASNHTADIKKGVSNALNCLDQEQNGILTRLKEAYIALRDITSYMSQAANYAERIESALIDLKDIVSDLSIKAADIEFDPVRKAWLEERLNFIYGLQQKHRVSTVEELLQLQAGFEMQLQRIDHCEEEISKKEQEIVSAEAQLRAASQLLSDKRQAVTTRMSHHVVEQLRELGMPNAQFVVQITPTEQFLPTGRDYVEFLFSANKNRLPMSIAQTASGGELSRLVLVIKSLMSSQAGLPTIVFDEIDTGVSGEIAQRLAAIMQQMSVSMQVIAITHLPQMAAKGNAHYKVYKEDTDSTTVTNIIRLTPEARTLELAEMLSGKNPSQAAIDNARELLGENHG